MGAEGKKIQMKFTLPLGFLLDEDSQQEWRQRLQDFGQMSRVQFLYDSREG